MWYSRGKMMLLLCDNDDIRHMVARRQMISRIWWYNVVSMIYSNVSSPVVRAYDITRRRAVVALCCRAPRAPTNIDVSDIQYCRSNAHCCHSIMARWYQSLMILMLICCFLLRACACRHALSRVIWYSILFNIANVWCLGNDILFYARAACWTSKEEEWHAARAPSLIWYDDDMMMMAPSQHFYKWWWCVFFIFVV